MRRVRIGWIPTEVQVHVADDRGTVPGALVTIRDPADPVPSETVYDIIPPEGPSPDCWLGLAIRESEKTWDTMAFAAREGAAGRAGAEVVEIEEE